jgi:amino acid transporter
VLTADAIGTNSSCPTAEHVVKWQFPGWGEQARVQFPHRLADGTTDPAHRVHHAEIGQLAATALSGNDLTSSALYTCGIVFLQAGWLTPVCLLCVAVLLYLFRFVYSEVGSALPINGGTYTSLLHTTSKGLAATAAVLSLLSYVATAVVSATDAVIYLQNLAPAVPVSVVTVGPLLLIFCLLTIYGIGESATVALVMFTFHIATLLTLIGFAVVFAFQDGFSVFLLSFQAPLPSPGGVLAALFFGFGSGLLGVSGFESSANMIESIKQGEYKHVLRNMHALVSFLNPMLALSCMAVLDTPTILANPGPLLGVLATRCGGSGLQLVMGIDAVVVLSGSVLTGFVGVTGLMERMAGDGCLPQFLMAKNTWRGTPHWIPLVFFILTASLSLLLGENVDTLSGVYTIAFLCVMQLFAVGNLLLKRKRPSLPRTDRAKVRTVVIALIFTGVGLLANLVGKPESVQYFVIYFLVAGLVVFISYQRASILRMVIPSVVSIVKRLPRPCVFGARLLCCCCCSTSREVDPATSVEECMAASYVSTMATPVVFFAKHADIVLLNKAALYVRENEQTSRMIVVHVLTKQNTGAAARVALHRLNVEQWKADGASPYDSAPEEQKTEPLPIPATAVAAAASTDGAVAPKIVEDTDVAGTEVAALSHAVRLVDSLYPKLRVDLLVLENEEFGPGIVHWLEKQLGTPSNNMFVGCPDSDFQHRLTDLGAVRVITRPSRKVAGSGVSGRAPFFVPSKVPAKLLKAVDAESVIPESHAIGAVLQTAFPPARQDSRMTLFSTVPAGPILPHGGGSVVQDGPLQIDSSLNDDLSAVLHGVVDEDLDEDED